MFFMSFSLALKIVTKLKKTNLCGWYKATKRTHWRRLKKRPWDNCGRAISIQGTSGKCRRPGSVVSLLEHVMNADPSCEPIRHSHAVPHLADLTAVSLACLSCASSRLSLHWLSPGFTCYFCIFSGFFVDPVVLFCVNSVITELGGKGGEDKEKTENEGSAREWEWVSCCEYQTAISVVI